ncbi:MAG TPA: HAMP domain-containing sensor histidine kinase [Gaiellaceae bacterium]|nr:HAMP domain-containing sensor histidine kinase [Gaiellaceae bacterium]
MSTELDRARIAVVVHEVRSPVAAVAAVAEALAERPADAALRTELVRLALAACHAIERIVLDLAVASVRLHSVDIRALVGETAAAFRLQSADVVADGLDGDPLFVRADAVRLRQGLDNLVRNALVHSGTAEPVRISVTSSDAEVVVAVTDAGVGISPDELERIFEPGERVRPSSPGSGLGLAVTRAIVDAHGGSIEVESSEGVGTTFTMVLPAAEPQSAT